MQRRDPSHLLSREEAVAATFDQWVRDGRAAGMERRHRRLGERMLDRLQIGPADCLLDIGCGDGWLARMVTDRVPRAVVVGIDISKEMIHQARVGCATLDTVMFAPAAAEEIPWADDHFTHVTSVESAYYWPEPERAAREIFRVTKPGGSFHILINYYVENPFSAGWDRENGLDLHRLSAPEWAGLFSSAGFEAVTTDQIPDTSPISPGKTPAELARRRGLQEVGALYVTGSKRAVEPAAGLEDRAALRPFRIFR